MLSKTTKPFKLLPVSIKSKEYTCYVKCMSMHMLSINIYTPLIFPPVLADWLPVCLRIDFKIILLLKF